eukprot:NODE_175_length_15885_cov_0.420563.p7 type:complete len:218 gc:universal NODE_175_length_15885_cov_0.420563:13322-13975(+)
MYFRLDLLTVFCLLDLATLFKSTFKVRNDLNIETLLVRCFEVRQRCRTLNRSVTSKWLQCLQSYYPWRHCRAEVLSQKGAKWHILPGLNVTSRPVVHHNHAKYVVLNLGERDRITQFVALANKKCHLKLKVQTLGRTKNGLICCFWFALPIRTPDGSSRHNYGAGPTVVPYRQVSPVWHQCIIFSSKHGTHISSMLLASIKVCVVAYTGRHMHCNLG